MCWRNQAESLCINLHTSSLTIKKKRFQKHFKGLQSLSLTPHCSVTPSPLIVEGEVTLYGCLSVCRATDMQADRSDCGPDGPWCGWLDQVEHYQTTHSGWHKLWGISVLGGRGSTGTMETLQSNKLIRRETDTPVHYRVTETEVAEREAEVGVVAVVRRQGEKRKKQEVAVETAIKRKRQTFLATEGDTVNIPRVKIALDKTNWAGPVESKSSQTPKKKSQILPANPQCVKIKMTALPRSGVE